MISKPAHSSLGDNAGWVSDVPFVCVTSTVEFVARAQIDVGGVDRRLAVEIGVLEHAPAGAVHVVRDRQRVDAGCAPRVHHRPEVLRVERVQSRERRRGRVATAEDHVAVQVVVDAAGAGRGVLVGDEGRVVAGVVVSVRARDDLGPGGAHDVHVEMLADGGVGILHVADVGLQGPEDATPFRRGLRGPHRIGRRMVVRRLLGIEQGREHAEVVRVVADAVKVEGRVELHREAGGVLDGMALGEFVRRVRVGPGTEDEGVVGVAGVDVEVPEEGLALRDRDRVDGGRFLRGRRGVGWAVVCGWGGLRWLLAPRRQEPAQDQHSKPPHDPPLVRLECRKCV